MHRAPGRAAPQIPANEPMTNTAENLILDRFSDEALTQAEPTALLALAKELREQRDEHDRARASNAAVSTDYRRRQAIADHRCATDDMSDERRSERLGDTESEDDRHAAVEEIVKDVISGASISIDI